MTLLKAKVNKKKIIERKEKKDRKNKDVLPSHFAIQSLPKGYNILNSGYW